MARVVTGTVPCLSVAISAVDRLCFLQHLHLPNSARMSGNPDLLATNYER
jgi:hypothetical protein